MAKFFFVCLFYCSNIFNKSIVPFSIPRTLHFSELLSNLCLLIFTYRPRFLFFMISLRSESAIMVEKISLSGCFSISSISDLNISKTCNSEAFLIKLWTRYCSIDSFLRFQKTILNFFH